MLVPFPDPSANPYAFFETKICSYASSVLYQEIDIPDSDSLLTFDWYALAGASNSALTKQYTMNYTVQPNFQFRVDLMNPKVKRKPETFFIDASENHVERNLVCPSVTAGAQLDCVRTTVICGWNKAFFELKECKHLRGKRMLLCFRVVSAPEFSDALFVGIGNVALRCRGHSSQPIFSSGFQEPQNGFARTSS